MKLPNDGVLSKKKKIKKSLIKKVSFNSLSKIKVFFCSYLL